MASLWLHCFINLSLKSDIFTEPTKEEWKKVQQIFKDAGLVQDKFFGSAGRDVWNSCIANIEKELEDINE